MRLPRFRLSVRGMMAVVAVSAIVMATVILKSRHDRYRFQAEYHAGMEEYSRKILDPRPVGSGVWRGTAMSWAAGLATSESTMPGQRRFGSQPDLVESLLDRQAREKQFRRLLSLHVRQRKKYEHAARYPWLPVAPDTPEPD